MSNTITIAVSGPGKCGKDTICEWFRDNTILRYTGSTSWHARYDVFQRMSEVGIIYEDADRCYEDRAQHRQIWADIIDNINAEDKTTLYRRCLTNQDILNGIRNKDELIACKAASLLDLIIWIDKDVPNDCTQGYGPELCDIVLPNHQDLNALFFRLTNLSKCLGIYES